jgi:hypothetical protein
MLDCERDLPDIVRAEKLAAHPDDVQIDLSLQDVAKAHLQREGRRGRADHCSDRDP